MSNTGQGKGKSGEDNQIFLATNAVTQCISSDKLGLSKNYPFIILLIVFYFTVSHSHTLIMNSKTACNDYIQQTNYDNFISSFIYWIISFILIIIIKYNGLNLINNFVINSNIYSNDSNIPDLKLKGRIIRGVSIVDYFISGITSIMNIYFIVLLLITLYKIIKQLVGLIQCDSEICTKSSLCTDQNTDLSKVKYYNSKEASGKCVGKDGTTIPTHTPTPVAGAFQDGHTAVSPPYDPKTLHDDLLPDSITDIINFWTFNSDAWYGTTGLIIYCIWTTGVMGFYIWNGFEKNPGFVLSPLILFIIINMIFLIKDVSDKTWLTTSMADVDQDLDLLKLLSEFEPTPSPKST